MSQFYWELILFSGSLRDNGGNVFPKSKFSSFLFHVVRVSRGDKMKSSYELAMERLNKNAPAVKLSTAQKTQLAELESSFAAKIAGREIAMKSEIANAANDFEKAEELRQQLIHDRKKLQAELEDKKDLIRQSTTRR